ncbi:MAG: BrnT family toxin [Actinomycetota bacterium]
MGILENLQECIAFEWDEGNSSKSLEKHRVSDGECEEIFFNSPLVVGEDSTHSQMEPRGFALGSTNTGRLLFAVFTIRRQLVRVISARDMTAAERKRFRK